MHPMMHGEHYFFYSFFILALYLHFVFLFFVPILRAYFLRPILLGVASCYIFKFSELFCRRFLF